MASVLPIAGPESSNVVGAFTAPSGSAALEIASIPVPGDSDLTLRPVLAHDQEFLYSLYSAGRRAEFEPLGLAEAQLDALLRMQFMAQDRAYHAAYPDARFQVVVRHGKAVGRLCVAEGHDSLLLVDISLLPEVRGQGLGSSLLHGLLLEAETTQRTVELQVDPRNPALRLYQRLGFQHVSGDPARDAYLTMRWGLPLEEVS